MSKFYFFRDGVTMNEDIGKVAAKLTENLEKMDIGSDDEEDDMPIFTPELAAMKAKEQGKAYDVGNDDEDENASDGD